MSRTALGFALLLVAAPAVHAQDGPFPRGEAAPNVHHTGTVWLNELAATGEPLAAGVTLATFAAGARLDWHAHPGGQVLLVTEGEGYYQEAGGAVQRVRAGDVIRAAPGVRHWHAAAPDHGVVFLAVTGDHASGRTLWGEPVPDSAYAAGPSAEGEVLALSRQKWLWMADRDVDALRALFHSEAVFVHMGGAWGTERELEIIGGGGIHYAHAEVEDASVRIVGETAVVLNTIVLDAVVGGTEVTNPFEVTEVYVREAGGWKLASLSFTRLAR